MQLPRSVLPSQKYIRASDHAYEDRHEVVRSTRQPLGESNGNIQPHSLATSAALCYNELSLPQSIHSASAPSILPTQVLTSIYGTSLRGQRSLHRNASLQGLPMGHQKGKKNPIYNHKNFADYRNKVMQKELDKEKPVWPEWLEDAFLDALLLIPQLGRKKFCSKTTLFGRNMLITEYLWIYYWMLHPPKEGEQIPSGKQREKTRENPGHPMFRSRKQVSSHIQVLKAFFLTLVAFHFIFPRQKDGLDDDGKLSKEEDDTESFKNNHVLISITNGRLPDERPNYEYFSRLLNAENDVFIRPKTCWIFVSSPQITLKERLIATEDGTMKKQITGNHPDGLCLTEEDYPHLNLNEGKDCKDLPRQGDRPVVLLHEYTRTLAQKESSSVKDISRRWDAKFPALRQKLTGALADTRPSDEQTSRCVVGPCDTFHFETVLDLHSTSKFPPGSDMNGLVEFTISRPDLHNHIWRSRTCVIKPESLYMSGEENVWEQSNPIDVTPCHRAGCNGISRCDCVARGNRDSISIPFPASSWANTFIKLAPFVTAERERRDRERAAREAVQETKSRNGQAERETGRVKKEKEASPPHLGSNLPSPKELLAQVAMYQEIWSAPQIEAVAGNGEDSTRKRGRGKWTRRGVILWTFVPVDAEVSEEGRTTAVPPGTNWRFLTKLDPTSSYHQQHAYVSGSPRDLPRKNIVSSNPGHAQRGTAVMHDNPGAAYDSCPTTAFTLPSHTQTQTQTQNHQHATHLHQTDQLAVFNDVLDGFSNGLITPPPTATLSASYPHAFDNNSVNIDSGHTLHHHLSFMSDRTSGTSSSDHTQASFLASNDANPNGSFLSGLDVPDYMPDFHAVPSTDALCQLPHRYMDTDHRVTEADVAGWVHTGALIASSAAEPQWTAAASIAAHTQNHGLGETHATLSSAAEHQDTWTAWQASDLPCIPSSYSRRTSDSLWDEGSPDIEGEKPSFPPGSTGLLPPPSHAHPPLQILNRVPALTSHTAQQRRDSATLTGRKRSRTESVGLDADDECENFPAQSIRKLAHHPASAYAARTDGKSGAGGAPTAAMGEGPGGFL